MVIAVRKDLAMGKGKIAAQVAHAAVACTLISMKKNKKKRYNNKWPLIQYRTFCTTFHAYSSLYE